VSDTANRSVKMVFDVCVPAFNAATHWDKFAAALKAQSVRPDQVTVVDSESTDNTAELAEQAGFRVVRIARKDFGHGRTRQLDFVSGCRSVGIHDAGCGAGKCPIPCRAAATF
jgi:glycosyltransferase involved in cell wall biosynthesis